jgi:hypothetical protein
MEMTEIRKQSLTAVEGVTEQIVSLAAQARELLGYDVLGKQTGAIQTMELTELQMALKELEIEIMFPADVERYQRERQIEQTKLNFEKWLQEFSKSDVKLHRWNRFDGPAWGVDKISEYKQPIPEFVLAKAVQIKQRVPECEIYVESLQDHPDPFLIVATATANRYDEPKERYYVEVWAEPKFEGRL